MRRLHQHRPGREIPRPHRHRRRHPRHRLRARRHDPADALGRGRGHRPHLRRRHRRRHDVQPVTHPRRRSRTDRPPLRRVSRQLRPEHHGPGHPLGALRPGAGGADGRGLSLPRCPAPGTGRFVGRRGVRAGRRAPHRTRPLQPQAPRPREAPADPRKRPQRRTQGPATPDAALIGDHRRCLLRRRHASRALRRGRLVRRRAAEGWTRRRLPRRRQRQGRRCRDPHDLRADPSPPRAATDRRPRARGPPHQPAHRRTLGRGPLHLPVGRRHRSEGGHCHLRRCRSRTLAGPTRRRSTLLRRSQGRHAPGHR